MMKKEFLRLAIPNILTNLTIPLVSLVDVGLMGRMPSSQYIIAIGLGTVIFNFIYWAFGFLRMGTTGFVAQSFGKGNQEETINILTRGLLIALIGGLCIILLQDILFEFAKLFLTNTESIAGLLSDYFHYRVWDAPATISLFVIQGWLLGMQESKKALYLAVLVNGTNILMSYILVYSFNMSIKGVAIGTVISQYVGLIGGALIIYFKFPFMLAWNNLKKAISTGWLVFLKVNGDIFIRTMCLIFVLSFFKTKAANIDPLMGAANILLLEFITISAYGIDGLAFAAESISGKYFGARAKVKFKKSIVTSFQLGIIMAIGIGIIFFLLGEEILLLLTNKKDVVSVALNFLPWLILAPIVNVFAFIWDGIFIGCTASKEMRNTLLISTFFVFLPTFYLFQMLFDNHGIWLSLTLFMLSRGIIQSILFKTRILRKIH